jgi:hypothetical protein
MVAQKACTAAIRTDQVGKVFVAIQGMRRCIVCDQVFTRPESAEHATVVCWPEDAKRLDSRLAVRETA